MMRLTEPYDFVFYLKIFNVCHNFRPHFKRISEAECTFEPEH
jgi:hypothetical protein